MRITGKIRNRLAILFIAAFVSTLLIKPLHVLSHTFHDNCPSQTAEKQEKTKHRHDCSICHFTLSVYTPQEITQFASILNLPVVSIPDRDYDTYLHESFSEPSLRAPPAL